MESRTVRRVAAGAVALGVIAGALWASGWLGARREGDAGRPAGSAQREVRRVVPEGTRIRVEVLNTTAVRGLARKATLYLRDAGFDVVRFAGQGPPLDSTLVLDRLGHPEWAALASEALGRARVESRPDSSRYVDVTVLIGADWRPPPQTLYP